MQGTGLGPTNFDRRDVLTTAPRSTMGDFDGPMVGI